MRAGKFAWAFWIPGGVTDARSGASQIPPCCRCLSPSRALCWMISRTSTSQETRIQLKRRLVKRTPWLTIRRPLCCPARRCCIHSGSLQRWRQIIHLSRYTAYFKLPIDTTIIWSSAFRISSVLHCSSHSSLPPRAAFRDSGCAPLPRARARHPRRVQRLHVWGSGWVICWDWEWRQIRPRQVLCRFQEVAHHVHRASEDGVRCEQELLAGAGEAVVVYSCRRDRAS